MINNDKNRLIKQRAKVSVYNAIKSGKLNKLTYCQDCKKTNCRIEGHHEDYTKPLKIIWLCQLCHIKRHKKSKPIYI